MTDFIVRDLGRREYSEVLEEMKKFTEQRTSTTADEVWFVEHFPVFTQGQAGKPEHLLAPGNIPVVQSDRGGQVTYHGPGQLVMYVMFDLTRLGIGTRSLVRTLENTIIGLLTEFKIPAEAKCDAPGVYINDAKIASIGLRVRKNFSYHGIAFNVDMDLEPFQRINPCGFQGLQITQLKEYLTPINWVAIKSKMLQYLKTNLLPERRPRPMPELPIAMEDS